MLALYEYFVLFQYPRTPETQRTFQIFETSDLQDLRTPSGAASSEAETVS